MSRTTVCGTISGPVQSQDLVKDQNLYPLQPQFWSLNVIVDGGILIRQSNPLSMEFVEPWGCGTDAGHKAAISIARNV